MLSLQVAEKTSTKARGASGAAAERQSNVPIEILMRQLANLTFLLRDFVTALSYYRLAASEYKDKKEWMHHGACQVKSCDPQLSCEAPYHS